MSFYSKKALISFVALCGDSDAFRSLAELFA